MTQKIFTLGFSPCPNDTFIFDAMVNGKINNSNYTFQPFLEDVEQLNLLARERKLDFTKVSAGVYAEISNDYIILDSGSALGNGVGPILVSKKPNIDLSDPATTVAIPGVHTTANLLLTIFFPDIQNKKEVLFSDIENMVVSGQVDAGLLIHEGRFTYEKKGLVKLSDLGAQWEAKMHLPLPLGLIVALRTIKESDRTAVGKMIRKSIEYAYSNRDSGKSYIRQHARELDDNVIEQHINLYVNEFSLSLGDEGRNAIKFLLKKGAAHGLLPEVSTSLFNPK